MNDIQQIKEIRKQISHWNLFVKGHYYLWTQALICTFFALANLLVFFICSTNVTLIIIVCIITAICLVLVYKLTFENIIRVSYKHQYLSYKKHKYSINKAISNTRYEVFKLNIEKIELTKKELGFIIKSFKQEPTVKFPYGFTIAVGVIFIDKLLDSINHLFNINNYRVILFSIFIIIIIWQNLLYESVILTNHRKKNILYNFLREYYYETYKKRKITK